MEEEEVGENLTTSNGSGPCKELIELLKDPMFVDFFNTFLNLPVFGQTPLYILSEREWVLYPELPPTLVAQRDGFLLWLEKHRFPHFFKTDLYLHYCLCQKLLHFSKSQATEQLRFDDADQWLLRRCLGSVRGMTGFRSFLKETAGEEPVCFWVSAERLLRIDRTDHALRDQYLSLLRVLRATYLQEGSVLSSTCKIAHETLAEFANWEKALKSRREVLRQIQDQALLKLQTYWIPCFLTHFKLTLEKLEEGKHVLKDCLASLYAESFKSKQTDENFIASEYVPSVNIRQSSHVTKLYSTTYVKRLLWNLLISAKGSEDKEETLKSQNTGGSLKTRYKGKHGQHVQLKTINATGAEQKRSGSSEISSLRESVTPSHKKSRSSKVEVLKATKGLNTKPEKPLPPIVGKKVNGGNSDVIVPPESLSTSTLPVKSLSVLDFQHAPLFPHQHEYLRWVFSADSLAGGPFESFLRSRGCISELYYLGLWRVMDTFLRIALSSQDGEGHVLRRILAEKILDTYLREGSKWHIPLKEKTARHLEALLPSDEVVPWLLVAQAEICEVLFSYYDQYLAEEDKTFLALVTQKKANGTHKMPRKMSCPFDYKISSQQVWRVREALILCQACSTPGETDSLTEDQWRRLALEDLGTGGSVQMAPEPVVNPIDYKSMPFDELASKYPKLAVEQLGADYQLYCKRLPHLEGAARKADQKSSRWKKIDLRFIRKGNTVIQRPTAKPRSLMEILHNPIHLEFFKRFLRAQDSEHPLLFWLAVEKLSMLDDVKLQKTRINWIMDKFFTRNTNPVDLLQCEAAIIKEIPKVVSVTVNMLLLAQAHVFKAMDERWFKIYQDTFPITPEIPSDSSLWMRRGSILQKKLRKVWVVLNAFIMSICRFRKSMLNLSTRRAFEEFLRNEVHNDLENLPVSRTDSMMRSNISSLRQQTSSFVSRGLDGGDGGDTPQLKRRLINNRIIIVNFLVDDLSFYLEIERYHRMCDSAAVMSSVGLYREEDETQLRNKAYMIIKLFLSSEILPKLRVNISEVQKEMILELAEDGNFTRSLFHASLMAVFPVLIHFWKRYCNQNVMKSFKRWQNIQAKKQIAIPDYMQLKLDKQWYRTVNIYTSDDFIILRFTLSSGIQLLIPHHRERSKDVSSSPAIAASSGSLSSERFQNRGASFTSSSRLPGFPRRLSAHPTSIEREFQVVPSHAVSSKTVY